MSEMSKCNTGISLLLHNNTAVSSSKIKKIQQIKGENSHISGCACAPTPACDFAARVASHTE